jgi:hypothetical protein
MCDTEDVQLEQHVFFHCADLLSVGSMHLCFPQQEPTCVHFLKFFFSVEDVYDVFLQQ